MLTTASTSSVCLSLSLFSVRIPFLHSPDHYSTQPLHHGVCPSQASLSYTHTPANRFLRATRAIFSVPLVSFSFPSHPFASVPCVFNHIPPKALRTVSTLSYLFYAKRKYFLLDLPSMCSSAFLLFVNQSVCSHSFSLCGNPIIPSVLLRGNGTHNVMPKYSNLYSFPSGASCFECHCSNICLTRFKFLSWFFCYRFHFISR